MIPFLQNLFIVKQGEAATNYINENQLRGFKRLLLSKYLTEKGVGSLYYKQLSLTPMEEICGTQKNYHTIKARFKTSRLLREKTEFWRYGRRRLKNNNSYY